MVTFDGLIAICAKILCRNTYNHMTLLWVFALLTSKMDVKTHINHEIKCHLSVLKLLSWQGLPYCDANKLFHILAYFKYIFKHYMYSSTPISHGQSTQVCICSLLQSLHSYNIKVLYLLLFSVTCRVFTKLLLSSGNKFVFLYILITAILNRVQLSILISILFVWIE